MNATTCLVRPLCVIAAACPLLLAGCAAGPDFKRPAPLTPSTRYTNEKLAFESNAASGSATTQQTQRFAAGEALDPQWWKLFHSQALTEIVQRAMAGNRTLSEAAAHVAEAEELGNAQAGRRKPQVGLSAGTGRQKYGAEFLGTSPKPPVFSYFAIGPTVSYSVDYTGAGSRSIEQRRALAEVRRHQLDAATLAVTGQAVMQSLRMASLSSQIATVQALLERDRENLKLVHIAFDAGTVSRLDIVSAENQLASDTTLLPPLRQELSVARHALAVLLGSTPADATLPGFDLDRITLPPKLPLSVPSALAHRRPDILAAEAQLHAATAAVGVAEGNLYPHIDLAASTSQQALTLGGLFNRSSNVFGLTANLVAPLLDGGTLRAEKRAAVDAMQASAAHYEQTVLEAFGQVADSLQALAHGSEQLQARTGALQAAQDNVDLTRRSYHEGAIGVLQVLDAERRYQQARLGYVRAQAERYEDTVQLFLALGGGVPEVP